jgi:hypothetical protein
MLPQITSELIRAARALVRWEQRQLAEASSVSLPTVKRLEAKPGNLGAHASTVAALVRALEAAGIEFTNGERPGVRLSVAVAAEIARANAAGSGNRESGPTPHQSVEKKR